MILVAGGAGFIGSHMLKRLRREGVPHLALDSLETGHEWALQGSPFVRADLRSLAETREALNGLAIQLTLHFASSIEVGRSVKEPLAFWENNVGGTRNLLAALTETTAAPIIFSSTAAVYGEPDSVPIPEEHPKRPASPYGDTKLACEQMIRACEPAHGMRHVIFRYFNAAGSDPEGAIGEAHDPETHLIPLALRAAMGKGDPLRVFGQDYDTPDGTCIRDYVHVEDLVEAHWLAAKHLLNGGDSRTYNLGTGEGASVLQVIQACEKAAGRPVPWQASDRRPGDPAQLVADANKIQCDWGWTPKHTLNEMAAHAWRFLQDR